MEKVLWLTGCWRWQVCCSPSWISFLLLLLSFLYGMFIISISLQSRTPQAKLVCYECNFRAVRLYCLWVEEEFSNESSFMTIRAHSISLFLIFRNRNEYIYGSVSKLIKTRCYWWMSLTNRCHSNDREEQTGAGQAPGGARERDNSEGPDSLIVLQPPGPAAPPEPHRHTSKSSEEVLSWMGSSEKTSIHCFALSAVDM